MNHLEYDPSQTGFAAIFKNWQLKVLQVLWSSPKGANSKSVYSAVNKTLAEDSISRASIINFLEDMRVMGVFCGVERTGKGGHQWVYSPAMDESALKTFIVETMLNSLMKSFPDETRQAISEIK